MTPPQRNEARSHSHAHPRKAVVVHDGSAFALAADLRRFGFDVAEGPFLSRFEAYATDGSLAVIATRAGAARSGRLRDWTRQLCWSGSPVLAVGAAIGPVAELFGSRPRPSSEPIVSGRLSDVHSAGEGLFAGMPAEIRLALPSGSRFEHSDLSDEFSATAWTKDGELIGASHVFRPVHLLHAAALDSHETRPVILDNLLGLLRERGGRAFSRSF